MITLILEDFRSFSKRQFTFEECKSTLIAGASGVGKTTVFMGIVFAVYGTGKDLIRHGKRKCKVVLKIADMTITRTKGPERLVVEKDGAFYEKAEAQAVITKTLPHLDLGYVSQMMHRSFLMFPPAEKLRFIENIALDKVFVDSLNKNVKSIIANRKLELEKTKKQRETMENMLDSLGIERTTVQPIGHYTKEDESVISNQRNEHGRKVEKAMYDIDRKSRLEQDICRLETCNATIAELQDRITKLTQEEYKWKQYSNARVELEAITKPEYSITQVDDMIATWTRIAHIDKELTKAKSLQNKLASIDCTKPLKTFPIDDEHVDRYLSLLKTYEKTMEIERKLSKLPPCPWTSAELEEMRVLRNRAAEYVVAKQHLDELMAKKATCTLKKTCPVCKSLLGLWKGELFTVDGVERTGTVVLTDKQADKLDRDILALSVKCSGMDDMMDRIASFADVDIDHELDICRNIETEREDLLKQRACLQIDDEMDLSVYTPTIVGELDAYIKSMVIYRKNTAEYDLIKAQLDQYKDLYEEREQLTVPSTSLSELQAMKKAMQFYLYAEKRCNELICEPPQEESSTYRKMLLVATEKQNKLEQLGSIDITNEEYAVMQRQLEEIDAKLRDIRDHVKTREAYEQWKKVSDIGLIETELLSSYPRAVQLQSIIHEAEKEALEETLGQLNFYTQLYLEKFVDNLTVEFVFDSRITVDMVHNGHKTDVNSLSGGEYSRVMLAVTLALAEMHGVDMLMMDESVSSLDQDTTANVMEAIKENFNGTILCIAHQTVTGTFDHVIQL